jgi:hypothetical protein
MISETAGAALVVDANMPRTVNITGGRIAGTFLNLALNQKFQYQRIRAPVAQDARLLSAA